MYSCMEDPEAMRLDLRIIGIMRNNMRIMGNHGEPDMIKDIIKDRVTRWGVSHLLTDKKIDRSIVKAMSNISD